MKTDMETNMITLTPNAVGKVKAFFEAPEAKGKALRISLVPGGCSGYEYVFGFDTKKPEDNVVACDGFSVVVDPRSAQWLKGSILDYLESPTQSGFKITNPNVKSSCGCGKSNNF